MRYLLILMFCSSYLLVKCAVSKCYHGSNRDRYLSNLTIKECWYPDNKFCTTNKIKNGEVPEYTCGDDEFCTAKNCVGSMFCKKPGTFEHDFPGLNNVKLTITCCDSDMCNVRSSSTTSNRTSFSCLFYMSVFCYLYFVTL